MTNYKYKFVSLSILLALIVAATGCATCKPGKAGKLREYDIEIALDESLKSSSVIVDLVGVNASTYSRLEAYDMAKYWRDRDSMRHDSDKEVLTFLSGSNLTSSMSITNAHWKKWKSQGVTHIFVLADLPAIPVSRPGNQDARRQVLSLDECNWPAKTRNLKLLVQRSGIVVLTPTRLR